MLTSSSSQSQASIQDLCVVKGRSNNSYCKPNRNAMGKASKKLSKKHQKHLQLDPRGDGLYSGTFRWLESKSFPKLPTFAVGSKSPFDQVMVTKGWQEFLQSRSPTSNASSSSSNQTDLVALVSKDPSCLDALSFPITFVRLAHLLALFEGKPTLGITSKSPCASSSSSLPSTNQQQDYCHVLVIGASCKAEQRIWKITNYWQEIAHFFREFAIKLWFIGPEVTSMTNCLPKDSSAKMPPNFQVDSFVGTFGEFLKSAQGSACNQDNSIIVGFNTGFGNFVESGSHSLLFSWLSDLYAIAESNMPAIFACANDYADLNGEFAVQSRVIGANMLLLPQENPFSAASHLHQEGQRDTSYSRANSFVYVIRGFDASRRISLKPGDIASLQNRLDAQLDFVLQDSLGRCFVNGTVLSREQAAKLVQQMEAKGWRTQPKPTTRANQRDQDHQQHVDCGTTLETPQMELVSCSSSSNQVLARVHLPKLNSPDATTRVQLNVHHNRLQLAIPGLYNLNKELPFQVDSSMPVQAHLTATASGTPVLQILIPRS